MTLVPCPECGKRVCRVALENIASSLHEGEHTAAFDHGELDDLIARPLR